MSFSKFWADLQVNLGVDTNVKNWTTAKGYLGDQFKIIGISPKGITIESPKADTHQYVTKGDFEITYTHWEPYCSKKFKRQGYQLLEDSSFQLV